MKTFFSYLLHALFFFTRIPVGLFMTLDEKTLVASRVMLPLVGFILGIILVLAYFVLIQMFSYPFVIALLLLLLILLTGGFHEDALADTVDGFGGSHSGKDIITIMKDSRVGTYGSLALIFSVLLAYTALVQVPNAMLSKLLVVILTLSRFSAVPLMWRLPYVRHDSRLEKVFKTQTNSITTIGLLGAGIFSVVISYLFLGGVGLLFFFVICLVAFITGRYYLQHLGGATGDCFGATIKLSELACYIAAAFLYHL